MWNIFKKSNMAKAEQQRNLAVAHMRSSLEDIYKKSGDSDDSAYKSSNGNYMGGELPPGWSQATERLPNWAQENSSYADDQHYWWEGTPGKIAFDPRSQRSTLIKNSPKPKKYEVLPSWVEQYPGFSATAWNIGDKKRTNTIVNLVTYMPSSPDAFEEHPFAKIVFTEDNIPFKQMNNLCASVAKYNQDELEAHGRFVDRPYKMGMDGKIRDKTGEFLPDAYLVNCAVDDLYLQYENWRRFPDVESSDIVAKLTFAWKAVEEMQKEEHSGRIKNKIDDIRTSIKSSQERISELEREQNEMYEKAADALNLLEEYGYDLTKIEKFQKKDSDVMMDLPTELLQKLSRSLNMSLKAFNGYNNADQ